MKWGKFKDMDTTVEKRRKTMPRFRADHGPNEWNRFRITLRGDRVEVILNDMLVISGARAKPIPATGPLVLQNHNEAAEFRNIYIRELPCAWILGGDRLPVRERTMHCAKHTSRNAKRAIAPTSLTLLALGKPPTTGARFRPWRFPAQSWKNSSPKTPSASSRSRTIDLAHRVGAALSFLPLRAPAVAKMSCCRLPRLIT